jgi:hypothetical protein
LSGAKRDDYQNSSDLDQYFLPLAHHSLSSIPITIIRKYPATHPCQLIFIIEKAIPMQRLILLVIYFAVVVISKLGAEEGAKPNIVVILADDKYTHEPQAVEMYSINTRIMPFICQV